MSDSRGLRIRISQPADFAVLPDLWLRSIRATHFFLSEDDIQALLVLVRNGALEGLELWVLCENDTDAVVGFMGLTASHVDALFLDPSIHRRGGGRMLIAHARALKGALTVDVNEQNPAAVEFYKACGFEVIARSPVDTAGRPFPLLHMREIAR